MLVGPTTRWVALCVASLMTSGCLTRHTEDLGLTASMQTSPSTAPADGQSAVNVTLTVLVAGAPVADGVRVTLQSTSDQAQITQPAKTGGGNYTASVRSATPGAQTLSAYVTSAGSSRQLPVAASVTFTPFTPNTSQVGSPSATRSALTVSPSRVTADGVSKVIARVVVNDAQGNALTGVGVTFAASGSNNTFSSSTATSDVGGVAAVSFTSTRAETKSVTATLQALAFTANATFVAGPPVAANSSLSATPTTGIPANNANSTSVVAVLRDQYNNLASNYPVAFNADNTHAPPFSLNRLTGADGSYTFTLASQFAGQKSVVAHFNKTTMSAPVTFITTTASCASTSSLGYDGALPMVPLGVNVSVSEVLVNDFNNDGIKDLAASTNAGMQIALGRGHGRFLAPTIYPAQGSVTSLASCDMNNDGNLDIVAYNRSPGSVSVFLGSASGALSTAFNANITPGDAARFGIGCTDVTGDGNADIIATTYTTTVLTIFPGDGHGGLGAGSDTPLNTYQYWPPTSLAVADVTGDGLPDAIIPAGDTRNIVIFPGDGHGGWVSTNSNYVTAQGGFSVEVADLNGDGKLDLAVPIYPDGTVAVLLNQGGGVFPALPTIYTAGTGPTLVRAADMNADGKVDLIVKGVDLLFILNGNGDGTFGGPRPYHPSFQTNSIVATDIDADTIPDIVGVAAANGIANCSILLGLGNGGVAEPAAYPVTNDGVALTAGDVTGDGFPDIAAINSNAPYAVSILSNAGNGTFSLSGTLPVSVQPQSVALLDLEGDGDLDIVLGIIDTSGGLAVFLNAGSGAFSAQSLYATNGTSSDPAAGDFNNDGILDLATADRINSNGDNSVSILLGASGGGFKPFTAYSMASIGAGTVDVATADLDHDGVLDLGITLDGNGQFAVMGGDGTGAFVLEGLANQPNTKALAFTDYTLDGNTDLVLTYPSDGNLKLFPGRGNATFSGGTFVTVGGSPMQIALTDFNGDGTPDFLVNEASQAAVAMLLGTIGPPPKPVYYLTGNAPSKPVAADFNRDGLMDFALAADGAVNVYLNNSCQ